MAVLQRAERVELLSLSPYSFSSSREEAPTMRRFHDWPVIGSTTDVEPAEWQALLALLEQSLREAGEHSAGCFQPRHGVQVELHGEVVDLQICFACSGMRVQSELLPNHSSRLDYRRSFTLSSLVEPAFSAIYERAGLTIAPGRK